MLTAAITAAIAALLGLFGIKPGAYLVGVAVVVKIVIVALGLLFGVRIARRREAARVKAEAPTPSGPAPGESGGR